MTITTLTRPALLLLIAVFGLLLGGCAADRPAMKSIEPDWSHHEASHEVSTANEEVWERFAARRTLVASDASQVAKFAETPASAPRR